MPIAMELPGTFEEVEACVAAMLAEGAENRTCAGHTPVVATADGDVRVMVLRAFDRDTWTMRFHTDLRAPKCAVVADDPALHVLIYDRDAKTQLRIAGTGEIVSNGKAVDDAWNASTRFARRCYMGDAPGDISDEPTTGLPAKVEGVQPSERELAAARANFALLRVRLHQADWFTLDHHGHRRAIIDLTRPDNSRWVAP